MTQYLQNVSSGRLYVYTPELAERSDMRPYNGPDPFRKSRIPITPAARRSIAVQPIAEAAELPVRPGAPVEVEDPHAELRRQYKEILGKTAPKTMKPETMQARIDLALQDSAPASDPAPADPVDDDEDEGDDSVGFDIKPRT